LPTAQRTPLFRQTAKRIEPIATFVALGGPEQSPEWSVELVTGSGTTMNKTLITFGVLTSLCAAAAVTSLSSGAVNAQEKIQASVQESVRETVQEVVLTTQKAEQPVQEDCSRQVWPHFSQACLRGRDVQVSVRNVSVRTPVQR